MKQFWYSHLVLAGILLGCSLPADAQTGAPNEGYNAFRLVRTRNVFDPDRRAMSRPDSGPPRQQTPRSNFIALTGTLVTPEKALAFFTGSRPEYSKVARAGDMIADFKISAITQANVELALADKRVTVIVGRQVPLEGSSAADTTAATDSQAPAEAGAPAAASTAAPDAPITTTPGTGAGPAPDKNEVLRRMMERRQKETSK